MIIWLARCNISFNSLEDKHILLYHEALSSAPPPSARVIATTIKKVARVVREQVNKYLSTMKAFSITTDAWTDLSMRKFISVTYHCLDPKTLELISFPCDMLYVPESHTWWQITNCLKAAIDTHTKSSLLTTVVTDNGANFVKMSIALLQNVGKEVFDNHSVGPDDWEDCADNMNDFECLGWRCVCHTMQLAVLDVLQTSRGSAPSSVAAAINTVREITIYTKRSTSLINKLKEVQKRAGRPVKVPLLDCPTRWSTIFYMLQRFDQIYIDFQNLALLGSFDEAEFEIPCGNNIILIRHIIRCLKPLEKFIRLLEGDQYVTISSVPTLLHDCLTSLQEIGREEVMRDLSSCLINSINVRLGFILEKPNLALCASALDPRYGHLRVVSRRLRNEVWDTLAHWAFDYNDVFEEPESSDSDLQQYPIPRQSRTGVTLERFREELNSFRAIFEGEDSQQLQAVQCPLTYWKFCFEKSFSCRILQPLLLCLYCIPASSAPSERMFSKAGDIISRRRSRMLPEMAQDLVLIAGWSKQTQFKFSDCLDRLVRIEIENGKLSDDGEDDNDFLGVECDDIAVV